MGTLTIGSILFALLMLLLFSGVWIAISLAAVAWFGLQFFTPTLLFPFPCFAHHDHRR